MQLLILSITLIELWLGDYFYHHYCTDHYFTVRLTSIEKALSKRKNASNQTPSGCCTSKMKQAREEQMAAQAELQKIYKENNVSMVGGIGCLPLLIQMPIFFSLFLLLVIQKVLPRQAS